MSDHDDKILPFPGRRDDDGDGEQERLFAQLAAEDDLYDDDDLYGDDDLDDDDIDLSSAAAYLAGMGEDQQKALGIASSGMTFVCIGIEPTGTGADFFTAIHGDADELRKAAPHLDGVIERALRRKGIL